MSSSTPNKESARELDLSMKLSFLSIFLGILLNVFWGLLSPDRFSFSATFQETALTTVATNLPVSGGGHSEVELKTVEDLETLYNALEQPAVHYSQDCNTDDLIPVFECTLSLYVVTPTPGILFYTILPANEPVTTWNYAHLYGVKSVGLGQFEAKKGGITENALSFTLFSIMLIVCVTYAFSNIVLSVRKGVSDQTKKTQN